MSTSVLPKGTDEPTTVYRSEDLSSATDAAVVHLPVRKRVLLVASGGGHWIELTRLAEAFRTCHCEFVSTAPNLIAPVGDRAVIKVTDGSRDTAGALASTFLQIWRIIRSRRPDLVVSTGAAPGAIAILIARLHGMQTIWIDSVANSDELSLSGRGVRRIAHLCLTQWPHLASRDRRLRYFGRVL
jgi:UDP-N-acetylglucosamine:LPS N-acetylglucosamine transferase